MLFSSSPARRVGMFFRTLSFLAVFGWCSLSSFAQLLPDERPWQEKMKDPTVNFYEVRDGFNDYWGDRPYERGKGFMAFHRWEWFMEPRVFPTGERFPANAVELAMEAAPEMFSVNNTMPGNWIYVGNPTLPSSGGGAGRINSVRNEPGSTTVLYACAPGGGLWKTTNSGTSWTVMNTDFLASIGASDVAIDPANPNVLYLATGDGDAGDTYSIGILKSTDGGATWNSTGLTWAVQSGVTTSRLLMHPTNNNILIAATNQGIYRTLDAGATWVQEQSGSFKDLQFKPGDPNTVYACGNSFYRSTNNGDSWTQITSGLPTSGVNRMAIAVSAANSAYVYILAGASSNSGLYGVYRSTDSGVNFTERADGSPNLLGWSSGGGDSGGQSWYDLCIVADPANAETIWTGGVNIWKSTDGGTTWNCNAHWYGDLGLPYVHADIHSLYFIPSTTHLLVGCDGGVFRSTNGGSSYSDLSSNLQIAQQYRLGTAATNGSRIITGWQDNGTNLKDGAINQRVIGGDGMECAIDPTNQNVMYGELYFGQILRTTTGPFGFGGWVASGGTAGTVNEDGAWVTPYVFGSNSSTMFVGKSRVYKTTDSGTTWTASNSIPGGNIHSLAVAASDNNIIYASKNSTLYKSTDGVNFSAVGGMPGNYITYICIHPTDPNKVWVTFSGYSAGVKVYETTNGGSTWTNISGTLPNLPANTIVHQTGTDDGLYIGMDAGVFYRDDVLGSWVPYMNDLPNVVISELEIHYGSGTISAATYGRGTWQAPLYALPDLDLAITGITAPSGSSCDPNFTPVITLNNAGNDPITSFTLQYQTVGQSVQTFSWTGTLTTGQAVTPTLPSLNYGTGSFTFTAALTSINGQPGDDGAANNTANSIYTIVSAPANDQCSGALPITVNGPAVNADNSVTCIDGPAPTCGGSNIKDVWYYFTYTGGDITIQTALGSNADTRIAVYAGCGGVQVGCNDDAGGELSSRIDLTCAQLTIGQNYFIQAAGWENYSGTFTLTVTSSGVGCTDPVACNYNPCAVTSDGSCTYSSVNDACAGAISLTPGSAVLVNNTSTCTNTVNPNCGGQQQMRDMWYSFVYTGGNVSLSTSGGTLNDPRLAVYTSCGGSQIACDDDDGPNAYALINFGCTPGNGVDGANEATLLVPGTTYFVQAGGFSTSTGTFNLLLTITNVSGCTDPVACNYNPCANVNNGSCTYPVTYYADADLDGFGNPLLSQSSCTPVNGYVTNALDCNDANGAIHPGATEVCNGVDDDCDGLTDDGVPTQNWYADTDGDGYGSGSPVASCSQPSGHVLLTGDCNNNNAAIYPGATETCNGVDDDCDGQVDDGVATQNWYADADGDGYGAGAPVVSCSQPGGHVLLTGDCNNNNAAVYPGATEVCNGVDDDCDGLTDEGVCVTCEDVDNDGVTTCDGDCDDTNADVYPGADEWCNGIDDDCDGAVDEGLTPATYYADTDGDGFGNALQSTVACTQPGGYVTNNLDCNDTNAAAYPGATEVCNGIDDDCDGITDEGCGPINDEMDSALILPVGNLGSCNPIMGTLTGATPSPQGEASCVTCNDVWYYFEATVPGIRIQCMTSAANVVVEVCDPLGNMVAMEDLQSAPGNEILNFGGLTEGNTYYVRVINYNQAQGTGNFSLCASRLPDTRCDYGPGPYSLCQLFKADYVGASQYVFHYTSNSTNEVSSYTLSGGSTQMLLHMAPGMRYSDSYTVEIDAVFSVTNGLGAIEQVLVDCNEPCTISTANHASISLRSSDACPFQRSVGSFIGSTPFVCGMQYYQWEFTRTSGTPLVITANGNAGTRFFQLTSNLGFEPGATYSVRIRPVFSYGPGSWGPVGCLSLNPAPGSIPSTEQAEVPGWKMDTDEMSALVLFPNPTDGRQFFVRLPSSLEGDFGLRITDSFGRTVHQEWYTSPESFDGMIVPNAELAPGLYFLELQADQNHERQRFVVQR